MKISCRQWVRVIGKWYDDSGTSPYAYLDEDTDHYVARQLGATLSNYERASGDDLITITFKDPKKATFFAMKYL